MLDFLQRYWYRYQAQRGCRSGRAPEAYCRYRQKVAAIDYQRPASEVRFVVFDSEATGLNPKQDRIISIGAIAVSGNLLDIRDSYEIDIFQDFSRGRESIEIHGIRRTELVGAEPEPDAVLSFLEYIGEAVLVAHHAWFDTKILHYALRRHWNVPLLSPSLDTLHLAKRLSENSSAKAGDFTLDALAKRYDIRITHRHKAAGDALVTAELLIKLLRQAEKRGIKKLGNVLKSSD